MELLSGELTFAIVYHSRFLENNALFAIYESDNYFIMGGPALFSEEEMEKNLDLSKPYFLVISKSNMEIAGFLTCMEKSSSIKKLKKRVQKFPIIVGKDGRNFYDTIKEDISNRTIERCVINANFYGGPDPEDIKECIDEQLKNVKKFIQI